LKRRAFRQAESANLPPHRLVFRTLINTGFQAGGPCATRNQPF